MFFLGTWHHTAFKPWQLRWRDRLSSEFQDEKQAALHTFPYALNCREARCSSLHVLFTWKLHRGPASPSFQWVPRWVERGRTPLLWQVLSVCISDSLQDQEGDSLQEGKPLFLLQMGGKSFYAQIPPSSLSTAPPLSPTGVGWEVMQVSCSDTSWWAPWRSVCSQPLTSSLGFH